MNIHKKSLFLTVFLLLLGLYGAVAQISRGGTPYPASQPVHFRDLTGTLPDLDKLANRQVPDKHVPFRFAEPVKVRLGPGTSGQWETSQDGTRIWRLGIRYKHARSLGIIFNGFRLEKGEKVFVYDPSGHTVLGAFTSDNNKPWGTLALAPLPGDEMVIEYQVPAGRTRHGTLSVGQVSVGFRDVFRAPDKSKDDFFGHSGACNVDINCDAGADWQVEKNAVVRVFVNNNTLCTGVLMNTALNDATPYLLTAGHCIEDSSDAANAVFVFQYESPYCHGPDGSVEKSMSGSTLKATTGNLDFTLVQLTKVPPFTYNPYFAGWDNRNFPPSSSVCIHHPGGDVKKISLDHDAAVSADYDVYDKDSFWKILQWDAGTTEGGSSGAPLFDASHRVVGTLSGGDAHCGSSINDYFQKLSYVWSTYPEDTGQLKHWLDPKDFQFSLWNGYDPYTTARKSCDTLTNIQDGELLRLYAYGGEDSGYWTGHNEDRTTEYAEQFDNPNTLYMSGIFINPALVQYDAPSDRVTVKVWSGTQRPESLIVSKDVPLSFFVDSTWNFIDFDTLVAVTGNFFAGYEIYYDNPNTGPLTDQFAVFQAEARLNYGYNTAFYFQNGVWTTFSGTPPDYRYTSLAVSPVLCEEIPNVSVPELQGGKPSHPLDLYPNPATERINISISGKLLREGTLRIQDLTGKTVLEQHVRGGEPIHSVSVSSLKNGFYLVTLETQKDIFFHKLILSR
ncbi:MAG: trypsin-like peptidase domain-containing protein [Bacteroidales bacterium]|nr:trypsin-like peptidase domain-containing protein [Bacteroidales bacterium]